MKHSKLLYSIILFIIGLSSLKAQLWETELVTPMPEPRSNNAVAAANIDGIPHIFSFAGIDSTKIWSGISNEAFRYNTETAIWDRIPDLPFDMPVIAAGASTINNKIYIVGGYSVLEDGNEISSDQVFEYDPETNNYIEKSNLLIPVDDQVQAVWRDSLIYVVTGWSDRTNISDVQIYNPKNDTWLNGTSVPNGNNYKVFGGSGEFIGDTLYYAGGAGIVGSDFRLVPYFRKGCINKENPAEIIWSRDLDELAIGYRMGVTTFREKIIWIGGSLIAYNFDGIAYDGSGGVPPTNRILSYNSLNGVLTDSVSLNLSTMDLRGVAKIKDGLYYIAGGMTENQTVTDQCFLIKDTEVVNKTNEEQVERLEVFPTIVKDNINIVFPKSIKNNNAKLRIISAKGEITHQQNIKINTSLDTSSWPQGILFISLSDGNHMWVAKIIHE